MVIELHHLHPSHDDEILRLKERIAELESFIDKEKAWSETLSKNGVTMSNEIERLKAENERMKARIAELERMDTEHTVHVAKMSGYIHHLEEERRWRKCSEEKPDEEQLVLAWLTEDGKRGFFLTSCFIGDEFLIGEDPHGCKPTYWMPLPAAPKEEK